MTVAETVTAIATDSANGLSAEETSRRLERFGPNALPEPGERSIVRVFVGQFASPLIYLLFVAAGIAFAVGHRSDAVVITDDNFATIVSAVEEGRVVYRNIKKAILLLFSTSGAEVVVLLVAMVLGYPPPFAAVQILWNNLITEGLITVNLVLEPAEGNEMTQPPIARSEPLLTRALLARMAFMVPAIATATLGWFVARTSAGVPVAQVQTETFTLLVICEWFSVLNCRSETKSALSWSLLQNPWLLGGLLVGNLLQVAAVFWPPLGHPLHTTPFDFGIVLALGLVGSSVLWVEEIRKWLVRRRAAATIQN